MHAQQLLNEYFANYWKPNEIRSYSSPNNIAKHIKETEWLLDVGCGRNPFKGLVKNIIGIDPAFDEADVKTTIEDYKPDRLFDVATCLGSINFGSEYTIAIQIDKVVNCLKHDSRIYWRLNPGRQDHNNEKCSTIEFFPWSFKKLKEYAMLYGYQQVNEQEEIDRNKIRLYTEWKR